MGWTTPKTDWQPSDSFDLDPDYARIRGNLEYLREFAGLMYPPLPWQEMADRAVTDFPYPDFLNSIAENTDALPAYTFRPQGIQPTARYEGNGRGWTADELNIIEGSHLLMYTMLESQYKNMQKLPFEIGGSEF